MSLSHDHAAEVNAGIIDNLRAENARLQAEVERQDRENKRQRQSIRSAIAQHQYDVGHAERQRRAAEARVEEAERRGDGYKSESETSFARARRAEALAERRKEALEEIGCERTVTTREGCREAKARGGNLKRSEWCVRCAAIEEEAHSLPAQPEGAREAAQLAFVKEFDDYVTYVNKKFEGATVSIEYEWIRVLEARAALASKED